MSMMLMVKAMQIKVGNPLRKLVLLKLADNANDKGECWPSYQHIADQCEISRSSVKNHVRDLEEAGLLKRVFRRNGERNKSNLFILSLDGAGADLGQELTEGGAGDDSGVGQVMTPEPVTLEPVIEPITPIPPQGADGDLPKPEETELKPKEDPPKPPKPEKKPEGYSEKFEQWWALYPRKTAKGTAWRRWKSDKLESRFDELIEKLTQQNAMQYAFTETKYIPNASTYLNQKRYDDEIEFKGKGNETNSGGNQRKESTMDRARREQRELLERLNGKPDAGINDPLGFHD